MLTNKEFTYTVQLKGRNTKYIDYIGLLMILLTVLAVGYRVFIFIQGPEVLNFYLKLLGGFLFLVVVGTLFSFYKSKSSGTLLLYIPLAICGIGWFYFFGIWYIAILFLVAAILERPIKVQPEFGFDEEGIVFNSFPAKQYNWNEVANVVIKFGMLSIDLKNNKLIQEEVSSFVTSALETEFNQFCKERIEGSEAATKPQ